MSQFPQGAPPLTAILTRYAARIVGLSFFGNLLVLALPLYTLQVYDRVLQSGSGATLLVLTLIVVPLTVGYGVMDYAIRRAGAGTAAVIDRVAAPAVLARDVAAGDSAGRKMLETLTDLLDGNRFGHLLDLAWTPLFLIVLLLIHPLLALVALAGIALLLATTVLVERAHGRRRGEPRRPRETEARFWALSVAQRETWIAHQALNSCTDRLSDLAPPALAARLGSSRLDHLGFTQARAIRMLLQVALMATGAALAIAGSISGGAIFAASLMMSRAVTPVESCLASWRSIGESWHALRWLTRELAPPQPAPSRPAAPRRTATALRLEGVTHGPPGTDRVLVRDLTCEAPHGSIMTVIGGVGTGKSTLLRVAAGIVLPRGGRVILPGAEPAAGYASQQPHLFEGTVAENIALFRPHTADQVTAAIHEAGVGRILAEIPGGLEHRIAAATILSGGQQQAICLARAFFGRPPLMLFDEPTARLDVPAEIDFARALMAARQRGAVIVVVTHSERILRLSDRLLVLRNGQPHEFYDSAAQIVDRLTPRPDAAAQAG